MNIVKTMKLTQYIQTHKCNPLNYLPVNVVVFPECVSEAFASLEQFFLHETAALNGCVCL
jgi:hypothetical protein